MLSPESLPVPPTGSFWGGAESLVWDLSVALGEMNHEVTLVARPSSKSPPNGFLVETFRDENDPPVTRSGEPLNVTTIITRISLKTLKG